MVCFTCQHCNAVLKKPQLQSHFYSCRKTPYLTCIDCLKDFRGDEHIAHTTCISEDQRYGNKDYVPKPVAVKQNEWLDVVQNVIRENTNPKYNGFLKLLSSYTNVPRKKNKFQNFCSNAINFKNRGLTDEIFDLFQAEFTKANSKKSPEKNQNGVVESTEELKSKKKNKDNKQNELNENVEDDVANTTSQSPNVEKVKKKSKKRKQNEGEDETMDVDQALANTDDHNEIEPKKKKHKKRKSDENTEENQIEQDVNVPLTSQENGNKSSDELRDTEIMSKKELKKLKKKQKYEAALKQIENEKNTEESLEDTNENVKDNAKSEDSSTKKKSKKHKIKLSEDENVDIKKHKVKENAPEENANLNNDADSVEPTGNGKFNWAEVIKAVLENTSDNELSIKRLSKKVLAEYQTMKGDRESYEQLISKFNKKINKTPGIRVLKDKAKLIVVE